MAGLCSLWFCGGDKGAGLETTLRQLNVRKDVQLFELNLTRFTEQINTSVAPRSSADSEGNDTNQPTETFSS